jgi:hypothetical protein
MDDAPALTLDYDPPDEAGPLVGALLRTSHDRHLDMTAIIAGLDTGALRWKPAPEANSLADLVRHIVHIESFVAAYLLGEATTHDGANGALAPVAGDAEALALAIARLDARLKAALGTLPGREADLVAGYDGRTLGALAVEELDHAAMHYGQVQLTRHLLEAAFPELAGEYVHWR